MGVFHTECHLPFRVGSSEVVSVERFYRYFIRKVFHLFPNQGTNVMDLRWDNLIVLDACRFDVFQEVNRIKGKLFKIRSLGSHTREWRTRTFRKMYSDIIYISANPYVSDYMFDRTLGFNPFNQIVPVWDWGWNDDLSTVHPKVMNETFYSLKENLNENRKVRFILHYMQPHQPFIGETEINAKRTGDKIGKKTNKIGTSKPGVWGRVRSGKISVEEAKKAYRQNLRFVLRYIKNLIPHLPGATAITSDHGELFGEHGLLAHPKGLYLKELIEVPYLIVED